MNRFYINLKDLSTEDGEIVDLNSKLKENAKLFLEDRCIYILVKVIMEEGSEEPVYIPLCDSYEKIKFASNSNFQEYSSLVSTNSKKNKPKGHLSKDKEVAGSALDTSLDDNLSRKKVNSKATPQKKK